MRRARGRPVKHDARFGLWLDSALLEAVQFHATLLDMTVTEFVRRAIREAIKRESQTTGATNA
jgi:hypothetical protein